MNKTESSNPNYSALVRAVEEIPTPPEWLEAGKPIHSTKYGLGEVIVVMGKRLIARFEKSEQAVSINNWVLAVETERIVRAADAPLFDNFSSAIDLKKISNPTFQEVAIELEESLTYAEVIAAAEGEMHPLPDNLPSALQTALSRLGISQIYSHQLESLTALREGRDISVVTATASGKTLCFNLAVLESCLTSQATALYLYPLKALAADQIGKLQSLVSSMPAGERVKVGLMTGDTSLEERQRLFDPTPPQVLGMSPDLLHFKLYSVRTPDGEPFREFLRRLRWVVIDESHTYVGSFGAHFTNLMRRLRLAVDQYGGYSDKAKLFHMQLT